MIAYLRTMERAGERIADGDLTVDVEPDAPSATRSATPSSA